MPQEIWPDSVQPDQGKTEAEAAAATRGARGPALNTVTLSIPADRDQVVLVRSVAAHIGVRLGLSVTELSDLRLAVDEACGVFLLSPDFGGHGETLDCRFEELPGEDGDGDDGSADDGDSGDSAGPATLAVTVSAPVGPTLGPDEDDIGWIMLGALVDELSWRTQDGVGTVRLVKRLVGQGA